MYELFISPQNQKSPQDSLGSCCRRGHDRNGGLLRARSPGILEYV